MKKTFLLLSILCSMCIYCLQVQGKEISISSPNNRLKVNINLKDKIYYSVYTGDTLLLKDCTLGLTLKEENLGINPRLRRTKRGTIDETIQREIPLKNAKVRNHCNTLRLSFAGGYAVDFRVFDTGIAYRFVLDKDGEVEVMDEDFTIGFPDNYMAHLSQPSGFKTSYEYPYTHVETTAYQSTDRMSYLPILLETNHSYKILISEADLDDYPCLFLKSTGKNGMQALFPKCPLEFGEDGDRSLKILKEADYIAKTSGTRTFPWRFFVITNDDRQIIANEMTYNLSSPCELEDYSWIKPGQVSWEWWHDARLFGVDFRSGYNMDSYKYYIDFASTFHVPYIIMDEGWAKSTRDPFTPNPDINLPELIQYGKEKNVKIILWLTWLTVENHFDLFKTFADWGVAGVKIDFMDRSDQWMVNFYERVAREAAKHKLLVDFHGSFKPAGLERRYPNVISYEGVLGMEQGGNCKPENSIWLPFIRNAVGPMDFTPGSMFSAQPEDNRSTRANAMGSGTRAYQMALFIVFESGLQMLADNPVYYYRERPCTEFITQVPVTWDETKVLDAKAGEYVLIARRSGEKWYIGAITNNEGRTLKLDFSFLPKDKQMHLTYFEDGINADRQAMDYKKRETDVNCTSQLTLKLVRNGGWAGVIE